MKNKKINNTSGFVKLNKLNNFFPFIYIYIYIYICTKKKGKKQLIRKAHEHGWAFNHRIALLGLIIIIILFCKGEENMLSPFFLKKKMTGDMSPASPISSHHCGGRKKSTS
jgi:hypothetical protein